MQSADEAHVKLSRSMSPVRSMFSAVVNAAFPVFALILTGWGCARLGIMGLSATEGLNRFVLYLALPAQLFAAMAHAPLAELARPGFYVANGLGMLITASAYAWLSRGLPGDPVDRLINAMSATYSNGFPILKWIGTTNARAPYIIQWSSNLLSVLAWTNSSASLTQSEGTNEVTLPTPPVTPSFLRVTVPVP